LNAPDAWAKQTAAWLNPPPDDPLAEPLKQDLGGLPPLLVQVGEDEVLYDDALRLSELWARAGNYVELDVHARRWHVFQIHAGLLRGATGALQRQADFLGRHWAR
jgi:acetyl esterase/lipase